MNGDKSIQLIKDLSRNRNDPLPPYLVSVVNEVLDETKDLFEANFKDNLLLEQDAADNDKTQGIKACMVVRHSILHWNRRCLLAYHHARLMAIKKMRWEFGSAIPTDLNLNFSDNERKWYNSYCSNLAVYMNQLNEGKGMDLTKYRNPPKSLYVQVRCLTDHGSFDLEDGTSVMLTKDSVHYLPLAQCEKLIHQAVLEQIIS